MKTSRKCDSSDFGVSKDVKEPKTCKYDHKYQFVEVDKDGYHWQYCTGCDRRLLVR